MHAEPGNDRRPYQHAGFVHQPGILRRRYPKGDLQRGAVDQCAQLFVDRDQPPLDHRNVAQRAGKPGLDAGVLQPALGLVQRDFRARQPGFGQADPGLGQRQSLAGGDHRLTRLRRRQPGGFDCRRGADAARLQVDLPAIGGFAQGGLFPGGGKFFPSQFQRATGVALLGL